MYYWIIIMKRKQFREAEENAEISTQMSKEMIKGSEKNTERQSSTNFEPKRYDELKKMYPVSISVFGIETVDDFSEGLYAMMSRRVKSAIDKLRNRESIDDKTLQRIVQENLKNLTIFALEAMNQRRKSGPEIQTKKAKAPLKKIKPNL